MPHALPLDAYLHLALAVGTTIPLDVGSAFLLVSELDGVVDVRLPMPLDAALQDELDGLGDAGLHREAVARATLCHIIAVLRRRLSDQPPAP